ncbi:hypothetical protein JP74_18625 [Devosia sp. 17-2-E-8]|nr:hypothetical protein JP74_18625 [Devosia sp. 17-2-E-8]
MTMHTHDDFGMATAGTISAVIAGASPDVALNGVSYRSGFAALEEVVLALDVLYGVDTGIRLDRLQWAANRLASIMGFPIPPLKPVVGSHQFLREGPAEVSKIIAGGGRRRLCCSWQQCGTVADRRSIPLGLGKPPEQYNH